MQKLIDITGQTFNRLTVTSFSHKTTRRRIYWNALCECGKETKVRGDSLKNGEVKSCGCLTQDVLHSQIGENNPNWKGGVCTEYHLARTHVDYRKWRKAVLERDDYTCKKCKQKFKALHIHHILPFASNKDLRYTLSNGIALCPNDHRKFHAIYGWKNNNYYQLIEFVNNSSLFTVKDITNVWLSKY